jgi:hypothetical protein
MKPILPKRVNDLTQGACFNIAYIAWFVVPAGTVE